MLYRIVTNLGQFFIECFSEKLQVSTGYVLGEICQTAGPIIHRVTKLWFVSSTGNIFHPPSPFIWGGVGKNKTLRVILRMALRGT